MKKQFGVVGTGKLGLPLSRRPGFFSIDCDITSLDSIHKEYHREVDVIINCAGISSIDECEKDISLANKVNIVGADNLMQVYGNKVLNLSSDYVFHGWHILPPTEKSKPFPVNTYGLTKMVIEDLAINTYGAKVIRLSRSVDPTDNDLSQYFHSLLYSEYTPVPTFFYRNYLTRKQAVDGIEYFVRNFDRMPSLVNYGSTKPASFYDLVRELSKKMDFPLHLLEKENKYDNTMTPRPKKAGFSVGLAKKLGLPMYDFDDVIHDFWEGKRVLDV